jgi:RimJ/RimL family protein N-acetyltransferase
VRDCPQILDRTRKATGALRLVIEVRTRNVGMNRVLQRLGHKIVATMDLPDPDGLAGPGTFNIYEIEAPQSR